MGSSGRKERALYYMLLKVSNFRLQRQSSEQDQIVFRAQDLFLEHALTQLQVEQVTGFQGAVKKKIKCIENSITNCESKSLHSLESPQSGQIEFDADKEGQARIGI